MFKSDLSRREFLKQFALASIAPVVLTACGGGSDGPGSLGEGLNYCVEPTVPGDPVAVYGVPPDLPEQSIFGCWFEESTGDYLSLAPDLTYRLEHNEPFRGDYEEGSLTVSGPFDNAGSIRFTVINDFDAALGFGDDASQVLDCTFELTPATLTLAGWKAEPVLLIKQ